MTAHVLVGSPVPQALQWLAAVLLFGGALAAVALRSRTRRAAACVVAALGAAGTAAAWTLAAVQPGPAPYALRITAPADGARASSPLTLTVCGVRGDGTTVPATDPTHYLVVFVDGHEVATVDQWQFAEVLSPGAHTLAVQLVTPVHHAFNPPATTAIRVDIVSEAPAPAPVAC
ncbi:MAG: hypothetical protein JOZ46_04265 [Candidatus Dormibacteraeota bacterium]|nr:hypothetical protein [Candidatus Dormibacteraeota bacterium]MBV9525014.1 hypothetical protein [Candidatus Dormibacteraeota bacterium]